MLIKIEIDSTIRRTSNMLNQHPEYNLNSSRRIQPTSCSAKRFRERLKTALFCVTSGFRKAAPADGSVTNILSSLGASVPTANATILPATGTTTPISHSLIAKRTIDGV